MPPRRSAAARSSREGHGLFRGGSPELGAGGNDNSGDSRADAMQVDVDMGLDAIATPPPPPAQEGIVQEGVASDAGAGPSVVDPEATTPAAPIAAQDIELPDATKTQEAGNLAPEPVDNAPPVPDQSKSEAASVEGSHAAKLDAEAGSGAEGSGGGSGRDGQGPGMESQLLASLPVYFSNSLPSTSRLQVFQYPTYPRSRPLPMPESARSRGLNPAMRYRVRSKRVEVELPLDLRPTVYDLEKGEEHARGAAASGPIGPGPRTSASSASRAKPEVKREHGTYESSAGSGGSNSRRRLEKTRLESTQVPHQTNYMVGVIRDGALHLTPVDSVHQLRPSMHYLDNLDMLEHRSRRGADAAGNGDEEDGEEDGGEAARRAAARVKSQAKTQSLNVSMRAPGEAGSSGGGAPVGSGGADGARGLKAPLEGREALMAAEREAESERWVDLEWKNEDTSESQKAFDAQMFAATKTRLECKTRPREFLQL